MSVLTPLIFFFNELPDNVWNAYLTPYLGVYDGSQDHNLANFVFYWRELFHIAGGIFVGIFFLFLFELPIPKLAALLFPILLISISMTLKEFLGDASEQSNGWDFKNVVDASMWTLGTTLVSVPAYQLLSKEYNANI